nr:hypothetical protein [Pandoravirus aubagnensis]
MFLFFWGHIRSGHSVVIVVKQAFLRVFSLSHASQLAASLCPLVSLQGHQSRESATSAVTAHKSRPRNKCTSARLAIRIHAYNIPEPTRHCTLPERQKDNRKRLVHTSHAIGIDRETDAHRSRATKSQQRRPVRRLEPPRSLCQTKEEEEESKR